MTAARGYVYAAMAALLWSFVYPLSRFCMEGGIPPLEMAFWRAFLAGFAFFGYACAKRQLRIPLKVCAALLLFGAIGVAGYFGIVFLAIQGCGVAMSSILMYMAPPLVGLFSWVVLRERPGKALAGALGVSLSGVVLVSLSGGGLPEKASVIGVTSGVLSGVMYALHFLVVKYLLRFCPPATIYCYAFGAAALVFLPFIPFVPKRPEVWAALLGMAIVSTFLAFLLYGSALDRLRPTQVAAIVNLDPVFSTTWAFLFFEEMLSAAGMIGGMLVLAGVGLSLVGRRVVAQECPAGA